MLARFCFVILPALLLGLVMALVHPFIGAITAVAFIGLGLDCTKPRPERGEH